MERDWPVIHAIQSRYQPGTPDWWYIQGYRVALGNYIPALIAVNEHPTFIEGYYDACGDWDITPHEPQ